MVLEELGLSEVGEVERRPDGVHQHRGGGEVENTAGQGEQNFLQISNVTGLGLIKTLCSDLKAHHNQMVISKTSIAFLKEKCKNSHPNPNSAEKKCNLENTSSQVELGSNQ